MIKPYLEILFLITMFASCTDSLPEINAAKKWEHRTWTRKFIENSIPIERTNKSVITVKTTIPTTANRSCATKNNSKLLRQTKANLTRRYRRYTEKTRFDNPFFPSVFLCGLCVKILLC
ncbi:MAG: hypothetical protein Ta2G_18640 [Termitinemataceae bacterium]|nr:MAG: hypothetical protein Ta2G_18640 [Termitinemataceae bacterium]